MAERAFLNGRVTLHAGDCLAVLPTLAENSIDAVVTDPPYSLVSISKRFGKDGAAPAKSNGATGVYGRAAAGFMGQKWDTGETAFNPAFWAEVLRVLKPGGHLLAFGGTRTYHRLACAIEDGGFEIRDAIMWHYGSGFPKSYDASKAIDKHLGAEREVVGFSEGRSTAIHGGGQSVGRPDPITIPTTDEARQWEGWGTALKPATEIICFGRKPMTGTVAANLIEWGVGAINIDGCRVPSGRDHAEKCASAVGLASNLNGTVYGEWKGERTDSYSPLGRWPANIIHDGSDEVLACFPETGASSSYVRGTTDERDCQVVRKRAGEQHTGYGDPGSAARFFYTAKADSDDRLGSKHPTVKPLDLMQYLVRLVTPRGGVVLDPFAGTGTTGEAAWREGFSAVLIEREAEYVADIERRMALALAGPDERARESIKARTKDKPVDAGPLFRSAV